MYYTHHCWIYQYGAVKITFKETKIFFLCEKGACDNSAERRGKHVHTNRQQRKIKFNTTTTTKLPEKGRFRASNTDTMNLCFFSLMLVILQEKNLFGNDFFFVAPCSSSSSENEGMMSRFLPHNAQLQTDSCITKVRAVFHTKTLYY